MAKDWKLVYQELVTDGETELQMVERHVRAGNRHLRRQRQILAELRSGGHPTVIAEQLLASLEELQQLHRDHLARLRQA